MADAGIGEAALAEGAKGAGEAAAATAGAGAAETGLGEILATAGVGGAEAAGGLGGLTAGLGGAAGASEGLAGGAGLSATADALGAGEAGFEGLASAGAGAGAGAAENVFDAGAGISSFGSSGAAGAASGDLSAYGVGGAPSGGDLASYGVGTQAGAGGGDTVSQALKALGSGALKYGPLINSTIGLARQGSGSAQKQLQAAAGPAQAVSNQLLAQFQSGQLTGADQYQIAQWSQQQKAKLDQYYSKAGLANSSMHQSALQQVDQQAEAMRQQAVQNLLTGGLKAAGVSSPLVVAGVNAGMKQDQEAQKAMSDFIAQLAKMNTPVPTGTPG